MDKQIIQMLQEHERYFATRILRNLTDRITATDEACTILDRIQTIIDEVQVGLHDKIEIPLTEE